MDEAIELRMVPNPKWVRGVVGGTTVIDSRDVQFVWEHPYYPAWYFPVEAVDGDLQANGLVTESVLRGTGTRYDLTVNGQTRENAAVRYLEAADARLHDLVRIEWDALDAWFEEGVEVFVHPRSPETRVDVLRSSKAVRVSIDGVVVAESNQPSLLFETGLPTRYYLPKSDVRMDLLTPNTTETACPYKGWANYWDVTVNGVVHSDAAWGYRTTLPEAAGISGLVCFYNEHVDLEIDGEPIERPTTLFTENPFA